MNYLLKRRNWIQMTWEEKGIAIARHNGTGKKINLQVNTWGCVYWTHLENVRLNKTPPPSNFWKKKINGWRQQKKAERIETGERIECEFRMKTANGVAVNFYLKLVEFNIRQKSRRIRSNDVAKLFSSYWNWMRWAPIWHVRIVRLLRGHSIAFRS
jgi:hypothetical protein